jgi:ABC-2 type transport system ATP-binding protein/lipopolysaccharide transport system ATP-binding protein
MASIALEHVSVSFPVYSTSGRSLKTQLLAATTGGRISTDSEGGGITIVEALHDVSLNLRDGDRVGLVGHNGAGKTTLLRVLAGIYEPNSGHVSIEGSAVPLLSINLGMDPESTGYENIVLRGLFLGLSKQQIRAHAEEIAEFTELGDFLNLPIRTYSDGMRMRLAFAISTAVAPDILLLDEGIGAGDAAFLRKASARLQRFTEQVSIIVLSSHSEHLVEKMCKKVVLMQHGRVVDYGDAEEMLSRYRQMIRGGDDGGPEPGEGGAPDQE